MLGKNLTKNDKELLSIIYKYGGYTRVKHLKYLYPDMTERTFSYKLDRLFNIGCLIKRRFINNSKSEPVTYQITQAGCNMCGNINSTYRRKRNAEYAYRALLKNAFFLEIHNKLCDSVIINLNERRSIFEKAGFNSIYFPKKVNTSKVTNEETAIVQFEEFILDFRSKSGRELKLNDELLYKDDNNSVIIVYVDQPHIEISKQIETLVNRYILMINQHINSGIGFGMSFLVVVDSDNRLVMYQEYIKNYIRKAEYQEKISDNLISIYREFYDKLCKKDSKFKNDYEAVERNFRSMNLRNLMYKKASSIKSLENSHIDNVKEQIKLYGIKYVSDEIYNIVKSHENDLESAKNIIEELFSIVAHLEYKNIIYLGDNSTKTKFDIKIFKTEICIYGE